MADDAENSGRKGNLRPWPKGVSGNPGGRPKSHAHRKGNRRTSRVLRRRLEERAGDPDFDAKGCLEAYLACCAHGGYLTAQEEIEAHTEAGKLMVAVAAVQRLNPKQRARIFELLGAVPVEDEEEQPERARDHEAHVTQKDASGQEYE